MGRGGGGREKERESQKRKEGARGREGDGCEGKNIFCETRFLLIRLCGHKIIGRLFSLK